MKRYLAIYALFVYEYYIQEDWYDIKTFGKILLKPFWYIRNIISVLFSIFCFPIVLLHILYIKEIQPLYDFVINQNINK